MLTVVEWLASWPDTGQLTLKRLTENSNVSCQRGQLTQSENVKFYADKCVIVYSSLLKQTKPVCM